MPIITFVQPDGSQQPVEIKIGISVMEGATAAGINGILAECGGGCACSTCHCYVVGDWYDKLPTPDDNESGLLDFAWEPKPNSRLTCQLIVTDDMDGLALEVPAEQI